MSDVMADGVLMALCAPRASPPPHSLRQTGAATSDVGCGLLLPHDGNVALIAFRENEADVAIEVVDTCQEGFATHCRHPALHRQPGSTGQGCRVRCFGGVRGWRPC